MNTFAERFSTTGALAELRRAQKEVDEEEFSDAAWGSEAGFGSLAKGVPTFSVPNIADVSRMHRYIRTRVLTIMLPASGLSKATHR